MTRTHVAVAGAVALVVFAAAGSAHDFQETRRMVLSVEQNHVDLLVAYELRPGPLADGLRARFDANHDGEVTTALERLARSQVVGPRLRQGLRFDIDGDPLRFRLERLEHPAPPRQGGRSGLAALALFRAQLPAGNGSHTVRVAVAGLRGGATLEAQAAPGLEIRSDAMSMRSNDPVLGPTVLTDGLRISVACSRAVRD